LVCKSFVATAIKECASEREVARIECSHPGGAVSQGIIHGTLYSLPEADLVNQTANAKEHPCQGPRVLDKARERNYPRGSLPCRFHENSAY
jgi:hypothetical protein